MDMSLETWGGGLLVVLGVLLWAAYFTPTIWRSYQRQGRGRSVMLTLAFGGVEGSGEDHKAAKAQLMQLRSEEKQARKAMKLEIRANAGASPSGSSSAKFLFRRVVALTALLSLLCSIGFLTFALFTGQWLFLTISLAVFLLSTALMVQIARVAARARAKAAPPVKRSVSSAGIDLEADTQPQQRIWSPNPLPKPVYLQQERAAGVRPEADVEQIAQKLQQEFAQTQQSLHEKIPVKLPREAGLSEEAANRFKQMGVVGESDGLDVNNAFKRRCSG